MKRFAFLLLLCVTISSCGEKSIKKNQELRFREAFVEVNLKDTYAIPFIASEIDYLDIELDIDDFIAYGYVSEDAVKIEGKHVGETTAIISYGDLISECKISVKGILDARFLATPYLVFGESPAYIKSHISGEISEGDGYIVNRFNTNWAGIRSTYGDSPVNVTYRFKNNKLDYVHVLYGAIASSTQRLSEAKSAFFSVLSERYRYLGDNKWERPGGYIVRMYADTHRSGDYSIFVQYAKDAATLNEYGDPSN